MVGPAKLLRCSTICNRYLNVKMNFRTREYRMEIGFGNIFDSDHGRPDSYRDLDRRPGTRAPRQRSQTLSAVARNVATAKWLLQIILFLAFPFAALQSQQNVRTDISLNANWRTVADDQNKNAFNGFETVIYNDAKWKQVTVPHNWDGYEGYRRMRHGNRHGYAWYRKTFSVKTQPAGKRYFLFFEGVGSYATIWLNGKEVGAHAGGRTTFTIDVTSVILLNNQKNILAVRADHPANIQDLPWVCGGCSDERGFSEGSQPMGIFRPVHLMITNDVRVEPFGVHVWNDSTVNTNSAQLYYETEMKNYGVKAKKIVLVNRLVDKGGKMVNEISEEKTIAPASSLFVKQQPALIKQARLWSVDDPYLYKLVTEIFENGKLVDSITTPYGIRWISWPIGKNSKQFLLNGIPVFINGIAEYEHLLGGSHAFSDEEIRARVMQIKAAGFNAFRDAHHPHNLRYQHYWDSLGVLWWTQMGAHIWYDSPEFRENFKTLLKEWVKERRNSPSLVLWGLQNESKLPEDFAKECSQIIRGLDPTTSSQRLVTTCNGGSGTDWDVPQNWTGTYGGDPNSYGEDLKKQVLVGEYGAWRTLDLHSEDASYKSNVYSEERFCQLLETKIRLAESVKDSVAGHFMWLFNSHDNPGRVQAGEGYRELDRIGPVNYKGLFTSWGEPTDAFYLYRSNYAPKDKEPMVYIVSHNWPARWTQHGIKNNIAVYSNCDEVELFNGFPGKWGKSFGRKKRNGKGSHFLWDSVYINWAILYAVGYVNGKKVTTDQIFLPGIRIPPGFDSVFNNKSKIIKSKDGYKYLYRVDCGGSGYDNYARDGIKWMPDKEAIENDRYGSLSWTSEFPDMPPYFASQRRIFDPIKARPAWGLLRTFRYGREKLKFHFPVKDGEYLVELYFTEPWYGAGGGIDCSGWRMFDVAINNKTVIKNLDIWKEVGYCGALKKTFVIKVTGGQLVISFPKVAAGQAVISAIAVATRDVTQMPAQAPEQLMRLVNKPGMRDSTKLEIRNWLDLKDPNAMYTGHFVELPPELFGAERIFTDEVNLKELPDIVMNEDAEISIGVDTSIRKPGWLKDFSNTNSTVATGMYVYRVYQKRLHKGDTLKLEREGMRKVEWPGGDTSDVLYLVAARPASKIEPAYDLKPINSYKAIDAKWNGPGISKGQVDGKDRVIFKNPSADNVLEWNFNVGVGDMYSLTISYNNPLEKDMKGNLQLFAADGTLMKQEEIIFTPTRPGKSNYINTTTGTMINAGNYILRLKSKDAVGLSINSLDVQ